MPVFFIAANQQPALLVGVKRFGVKLANGLGLGIKVLIVAVQPVLTLVGLEINVLKDTPDTGTADRIGMESVEQSGNDFIEGPPRDRATLVLRQGAGHRDDSDTSRRANGSGAPWPNRILQTGKAQVAVTPSPLARGAVVTAQIAADLQVAWVITTSRP
jgi:hypothetical protein